MNFPSVVLPENGSIFIYTVYIRGIQRHVLILKIRQHGYKIVAILVLLEAKYYECQCVICVFFSALTRSRVRKFSVKALLVARLTEDLVFVVFVFVYAVKQNKVSK